MNNRNTGPTTLPQEVLDSMSSQPLNHRSAAFSDAFSRVTQQLSHIVNSDSPALLLSCSGTGGLEASIGSIVKISSRVLVLTAGSYGDLLTKITCNFTQNVDVINFQPGYAYNSIDLKIKLSQHKYDAILLTHSESSTGIYHPINEIISVIKKFSDALLLVDVVSSLGSTNIDMNAWGADILVGATQKGLMAPAGMAIIYLSNRAESYILEQNPTLNYMNLQPWICASKSNCVPYTPAMNVFQGLCTSVDMIFSEGLESRYQRHELAARYCRGFFNNNKVKYFAPFEYLSHSITSLLLPENVSAKKIKSILEYEYKTIISTGVGEYEDRLLRVGHMGYFSLNEVDAALSHISGILDRVIL